MTSSDSRPGTGVFQFSLSTVFLVFTALSVFLGICAWTGWNIAIILPLALGTSGILAIVQAVRTKRWGQVAAVGVLLMVVAVGMLPLISDVAWSGHRELDVRMIVLDASELTPLPDATIEVLDGPRSSIDGVPPDVGRDFSPVYSPQGTTELTTDEDGYVRFTHKFFASGRRGLFVNSGYVDTTGVWLRVTVSGYRTTYMPVDRQSVRPRDIHDESPICVTVPVGRESGSAAGGPDASPQ